MSVVVAKIYDNKIVMACDSIIVRGWSKVPHNSKEFTKMVKYDDMILGGVGDAEELSLFFHYIKTHTIDEMTEKKVLDFIIEFKRWKNDLIGNSNMVNEYILAFKGKCFHICDNCLVIPVLDYCAIGAGEDYANAALYLGHDADEAVKVACELSAVVCEPIIHEEIKI